MMDPIKVSLPLLKFSQSIQLAELTGPTKSGINIAKHITFVRMKKNPNKVIIFGASHSGRSSTNPFHYIKSQLSFSLIFLPFSDVRSA